MAGSADIRISADTTCFAPAWLPLGGRGNNLTATTWAPIADLDADLVDPVLELPRDARVPAHAALAPAPVRRLLPGRSRPGEVWRLRVASTSYAKAEDLLMTALPRLRRAREAHRGVGEEGPAVRRDR
ncbi:hypothetical protein GXW82_32985 [Streptacidiphilus sp. 4-A2]|nr:hypothetical protein [Streptacidiphilus sp. 4-A2]